MKKNLANYITLFRLIGSVALIFLEAFSVPFLVLYALCGVSDALDGFIARALNIRSELGRKLDSVSDLSLYCIMLYKVWPRLTQTLPEIATKTIIGLLAARLFLYGLYWIIHHGFLSTHSILNKATSIMMFFLPFALMTPFGHYYSYLEMAIGALALLHEVYLILTEGNRMVLKH